MNWKKKILAIGSLCLLTLLACKKDADTIPRPSTSNTIYGTWNVEEYIAKYDANHEKTLGQHRSSRIVLRPEGEASTFDVYPFNSYSEISFHYLPDEKQVVFGWPNHPNESRRRMTFDLSGNFNVAMYWEVKEETFDEKGELESYTRERWKLVRM